MYFLRKFQDQIFPLSFGQKLLENFLNFLSGLDLTRTAVDKELDLGYTKNYRVNGTSHVVDDHVEEGLVAFELLFQQIKAFLVAHLLEVELLDFFLVDE